MYVIDSMSALNFYPHQLHFDTVYVHDRDNVRRHSWSPGYYARNDETLSHYAHYLDEIATGIPERL